MTEWLLSVGGSYLQAHPVICAVFVPVLLVATAHQYVQIRRMQWAMVTEMRGQPPDKLRTWDWLWFGSARPAREEYDREDVTPTEPPKGTQP